MSLIGSQIVSFSVAWWVTQTPAGGSPGDHVDLWDAPPGDLGAVYRGAGRPLEPGRVMIISDSVIALFALILALLFLTGNAQIWFLYVMALVRGTLGTFHWTAMQASTSLMVPEKELSRVAGMNQTLNGVLNIAAPPLGALW